MLRKEADRKLKKGDSIIPTVGAIKRPTFPTSSSRRFRNTDSLLTVSHRLTVSNERGVERNMAAPFIKANNLGWGGAA